MSTNKPKIKLKIKQLLFVALVVSFIAAAIFPGVGANDNVKNSLTFIGILFGIILGFFIADLYSRYSSIRQNAAQDSSCLSTFYTFAKILSREADDAEWLIKVEDRVENYVHSFMPLPWEKYGETEKAFENLGQSLIEIKYTGRKASETYSNMLLVYNQHSTARENLVLFGKDKLTWGEWASSLMLGVLLLASLFYIKDTSLVSIIFTGAITTAILVLFIVLRDLDNLNFGEQEVSVEPYERVLDSIGRPRYYKNKSNGFFE